MKSNLGEFYDGSREILILSRRANLQTNPLELIRTIEQFKRYISLRLNTQQIEES